MRPPNFLLVIAGLLVLALSGAALSPARADGSDIYLVLFTGQTAPDGSFLMDADAGTALGLVAAAGGLVKADLTSQIGVAVVQAANPLFIQTMSASPLVADVGPNFSWKSLPTGAEMMAAGAAVDLEGDPAGPFDPMAGLQWDMSQIRTAEAHQLQAGWRAVDVGVLDTGIDAAHLDFDEDGVAGGATNVDCARGRDFIPLGPGIGTPDPCVDNGFHGTHVAGTIAAQANGVGVVGVAPGVTLVPVKVCDTAGYCYASSAVAGITYAGDAQLDVINMSFFVDDDDLLASTEFKCSNDSAMRAFRRAVERAIQYARKQGVTPIAALGNSDVDLANPPDGNQCEVIPAESAGVLGVVALGARSEKASYSNYGAGMADVAAPGGNGRTGDCTKTILSTFPGNTYGCIQGTSMASPHAAGVAALIVSQYGRLGPDGDVKMAPGQVEAYLQATTIDIGLSGYDKCFGNGRIDALRAVLHDTSQLSELNPPCPEYAE